MPFSILLTIVLVELHHIKYTGMWIDLLCRLKILVQCIEKHVGNKCIRSPFADHIVDGSLLDFDVAIWLAMILQPNWMVNKLVILPQSINQSIRHHSFILLFLFQWPTDGRLYSYSTTTDQWEEVIEAEIAPLETVMVIPPDYKPEDSHLYRQTVAWVCSLPSSFLHSTCV
jgi:hypothetical protein